MHPARDVRGVLAWGLGRSASPAVSFQRLVEVDGASVPECVLPGLEESGGDGGQDGRGDYPCVHSDEMVHVR